MGLGASAPSRHHVRKTTLTNVFVYLVLLSNILGYSKGLSDLVVHDASRSILSKLVNTRIANTDT